MIIGRKIAGWISKDSRFEMKDVFKVYNNSGLNDCIVEYFTDLKVNH